MRTRVIVGSLVLSCWAGIVACGDDASPTKAPTTTEDASVQIPMDLPSPSPLDSSLPLTVNEAGLVGIINGETCDGVDNDNDGKVDNLDVDSDGFCDCLRIATIGKPREAGASDFVNWLDVRSGRVQALNLDTITPELISGYQVLIIQDVTSRKYAPAEITAIEEWVKKGGGLIAMTGYQLPDGNVNDIIKPYGLSYSPVPVLNTDYTGSLPVKTWRDHPITKGITAIGVASGYAVEGAGEVFAEGQDLLLGPQVLGRVLTHGEGKVVAWGDEWITKNSEWQNNKEYQVERFWQNLLSWLAPPKVCEITILM